MARLLPLALPGVTSEWTWIEHIDERERKRACRTLHRPLPTCWCLGLVTEESSALMHDRRQTAPMWLVTFISLSLQFRFWLVSDMWWRKFAYQSWIFPSTLPFNLCHWPGQLSHPAWFYLSIPLPNGASHCVCTPLVTFLKLKLICQLPSLNWCNLY